MIETKFDYNLDYDLSKGKLHQRIQKSRAKKARKAMVYKKIKKFITLGLMAVAVVGTLTSAKNFKVAALRVATNEEVQTILASNTNNTYTDTDTTNDVSEKEIVTEDVAVETVTESSITEYTVEAEAITQEETIVESTIIEETIVQEESIEEVAVEETITQEVVEVAVEETIVESTTEENIIQEVAVEETIAQEDDLLIYDKASEILLNATAEDITLTASKASDVMFKSQGGDKTEFSPWEELFGANVYRYPGLRFNIEAKINADRMSVVSGFDNDFYVVVDNIDREGIEYTVSLDTDEIMEMISQNGKTAEETKAVIEKYGDFFKEVIAESKKDIENRISGSYVEGMKTDNEFYRALNKQLSDSLNNEWKVTVLGAEA